MLDPIFKELGFYSSPLGPPNGPGVYAICVMHSSPDISKFCIDRVVYIGSSKDILKRVMNPNHIYRRLINLLSTYHVYTMFLESDTYLDFEKELIIKYKPRFNKQWAKG